MSAEDKLIEEYITTEGLGLVKFLEMNGCSFGQTLLGWSVFYKDEEITCQSWDTKELASLDVLEEYPLLKSDYYYFILKGEG